MSEGVEETVDVEEDADGQPDLDEDEVADFSAVADEIEDGIDEVDTDEEPESAVDEPDEDGDESGETSEAPPSMDATDSDRTTPGDIYCNALGMGAAVARASYGSAEADERSDLVDEYGDMARDLEIDQYVDEWLAEQGGIDELSPGQAILLSTVMFGGMVAMDDPDMIDGVMQEVSE